MLGLKQAALLGSAGLEERKWEEGGEEKKGRGGEGKGGGEWEHLEDDHKEAKRKGNVYDGV